jgi:FAD/FMN-containing dehydrogenase
MALKEELASIVGSEYVSDDPDTIEKYAKDYSLVQPRRPSCVVFPKNTEEIQGIVKYANDRLIPVTPRSSGISFYGAGIPSQEGIIIDLTRMNRILEIDGANKRVKVEAGVTWAQVQEELEKEGLMVCNPLLPHRAKSVLTSNLEGEPMLTPKSEYSDPVLSGEVVLANGEVFRTGTAVGKAKKPTGLDVLFPGGRIFNGAQGTLGIMAWANLKAQFLPTMDRLLFMPFDRIEDLPEPIYRIQRRMLGRECFALNSFNLAAIVAEKWPDEFNNLRESLPPWILLLCLSGLHRLPEEKIEYEEEALTEVASELHFKVLPTLSRIPGLDKKILAMLRKPWTKDGYWKFLYKGSSHDIFFFTTMNRVPEFTKAIEAVAPKYEYPIQDIGFYLQPVEYGRACCCYYSFHCNPEDAKEVAQVRRLYLDASELAISMGALFTNPYGPWADMVYSRTAVYTSVMKVIKNAFDPSNILNPGKLCF